MTDETERERSFYDSFYRLPSQPVRDSTLLQSLRERAVQEFLGRARVGSDSRILSLGCGDGATELLIAASVGEVVGIDISDVGIADARRLAGDAGVSNAAFHVFDAGRPLDLGQERFDAVCAFGLLHHLAPDGIRQALANSFRSLRPRGVFYSMDRSSRRFVRLLTPLVRGPYRRYHSSNERELNADYVVRMSTEAGFVAPHVWPADFAAGPLGWLLPGIPAAVASRVVDVDRAVSGLPLVGSFASSFALMAAKPD